MNKNDVFIYMVIAVGLFVAGAVWAPGLSAAKEVKEALECTSYIATVLACAVAISALTSWRAQFRHSEKYNAIKTLTDAALGMQVVRSYLFAMQNNYGQKYASGGVPIEILERSVDAEREVCAQALRVYQKAWITASALLSESEQADYPGVYAMVWDLVYEYPLRMASLYAECEKFEFFSRARELINEHAKLHSDMLFWLKLKLRQLA